jgi:ATP-dependent phosphofructokinase / diphosphate-dependent phosphofructokinase
MRIAISTGGGDAPGLNAVIRAVVLSAYHRGWQSYGIQRGYEGLLSFNGVVPLGPAAVRGITHIGGTILGTTNRGNPFRYITRDHEGNECEVDRSNDLVAAFQASGFDALVSIGGDGSLQISHELWRKGLPVVCVPKTIDNDVSGTITTFGFDTAVQTALDAIDKLHTTAESHDRVFVLEVMGRDAGFIALHSGLAGSADVILIPEIPYEVDRVCDKVMARSRAGRHFSIVVMAEGAAPRGGQQGVMGESLPGQAVRVGGVAADLAREIQARTGKESRSMVLGHLQRGGPPTGYDRLLATRFGGAAVRAVEDGKWGEMVALQSPHIVTIPIEEALKHVKRVDPDHDTVRTARAMGISFGD